MWLAINKALLVDGARQVGKTYLIDAFCKKYFENYIYINLALNPQAIPAFSQAKDVKDFLLVVSAFSASPLSPSKNNHIHRWDSASKKQGEVDFLITYQDEVLPIEIKSGKDYKEHSALNNLISKKEYDIRQALIFGNCNVEIRGEETYLPIYMIDFLRQETI